MKEHGDIIVDSVSAGFKKCPRCGNHSLRENGWCDNGCYKKEQMEIIDECNLRYKCNFCGDLFFKASECAKHIEKESHSKVCFPSDILMVDISKEVEK